MVHRLSPLAIAASAAVLILAAGCSSSPDRAEQDAAGTHVTVDYSVPSTAEMSTFVPELSGKITEELNGFSGEVDVTVNYQYLQPVGVRTGGEDETLPADSDQPPPLIPAQVPVSTTTVSASDDKVGQAIAEECYKWYTSEQPVPGEFTVTITQSSLDAP